MAHTLLRALATRCFPKTIQHPTSYIQEAITKPEQMLVACQDVVDRTASMPNREAWHAVIMALQDMGFTGRRLVQMRDITWSERQNKATAKSKPYVFRPSGCGPVIDDILRKIEEPLCVARLTQKDPTHG